MKRILGLLGSWALLVLALGLSLSGFLPESLTLRRERPLAVVKVPWVIQVFVRVAVIMMVVMVHRHFRFETVGNRVGPARLATGQAVAPSARDR